MSNGTRTTLPLPSLCPPQLCAEKPGLDFSAEMGRSQRAVSRLHHWIGFAVAGFAAVCLCAAETVSSSAPDAIPKLPVTTGWLGNSLLRGGQADWKDKSQTFLQLYTSDLAVTGDGRTYCTTTGEEGARAAGIYQDGDALEDIPSFGVDSGSSVAVTDKLLAYGRKGRIGVFPWTSPTSPRANGKQHRRSSSWACDFQRRQFST